MTKIFERIIVKMFLPICFNIYVLGAQKNRFIEMVALSTHSICFGLEIKKNSILLCTLN